MKNPTTDEIRIAALSLAEDCVQMDGSINTTQLAENTAHHFDHDEWLDDETHEVWDIVADLAAKLEAYNAQEEE